MGLAGAPATGGVGGSNDGAGAAGGGAGAHGSGGATAGTSGGAAGTQGSGGAAGGRAGGGEAGSQGSGGATGGSAGAAATTCTGQIIPSQPPVTLAATVDCTASFQLSIAAGPVTDEAYVGFTTGPALLATIQKTGVSIEVPGFNASQVIAMVDGTGGPELVGSELDNQGVGYFARSGSSWPGEIVSPIPTDSTTFYEAWGAALGADGQPRVLFSDVNPAAFPLVLAQRAPSGSWSNTQITGPIDISVGGVPAGMTIDSNGLAHVFFLQPVGPNVPNYLCEWIEGQTARALGYAGSSSPAIPATPQSVAAGLGGFVGVAGMSGMGIAVEFVDGPTAGSDQVIPGTAPAGCTNPTCAAGTCKTDQIRSPLALTATSDGEFWLAYAVDHLDYDYTASYNSAHTCQQTTTTTRSTEEVVLVRLAAGVGTAIATKWRTSTPLSSVTSLALASQGSRLYLAISERQISVFALDWTSL
jgi:hypothetical protein